MLQLERYDGRIELQTEPPPGVLTVILTDTANDRASANGLPIDSRDMLIMAPGSELHATTPGEVDVYSVHIPQSRFAEAAHWLSPGRPPGPRAGVMSLRADSAAMDALRQAIIRVSSPHLPDTTRKQCSLNLVARIIEMTTEWDGVSCSTDRNSSRHALRRAREYIEAHMADPISMADVCRYSGASNSTLLRLFRHELGMPPTQYILARRLNAARRTLLACDPRLTRVADIGYSHGLDHLGRFASRYRAYFSETPRQTLNQVRDESRRKA